MTPDQITKNAIAAGRRAVEEFWSTLGHPEDQGKPFSQAEIDLIFIRAYEAAMWRPIEEAPRDGTEVIVNHPLGGISASVFIGREWRIFDGPDGTTGYIDPPTHFRPLPQPPEVKP